MGVKDMLRKLGWQLELAHYWENTALPLPLCHKSLSMDLHIVFSFLTEDLPQQEFRQLLLNCF
jgi:hypothetical protein